jgi:hypothetical protein
MLRRTRDEIDGLGRAGLDWITFSTQASEVIQRTVPFQRSCWHTVDPRTVLFTGSLNHSVACSGTCLAEHEYAVEDVNKWWFLARSGRYAGATSLATHGDLSRSVRHRSQAARGIGDELRGSFVVDGTYWGAAGFLRDEDEPWFTEEDVAFLASLSRLLAEGLRRALLVAVAPQDAPRIGPGVVVFDEGGQVESISPAAERWIEQLVEVPRRPCIPSRRRSRRWQRRRVGSATARIRWSCPRAHGHGPARGSGCCCTARGCPAQPRAARPSSSSPPLPTRWRRWLRSPAD